MKITLYSPSFCQIFEQDMFSITLDSASLEILPQHAFLERVFYKGMMMLHSKEYTLKEGLLKVKEDEVFLFAQEILID
jgi:hypothetical protein